MILPLEKQVCSLELAKRLKELGVSQDSMFQWANYSFDYEGGWWPLDNMEVIEVPVNMGPPESFVWYAAYTVAELGEMLPSGIQYRRYMEKDCNFWDIYYPKEFDVAGISTEADARAKMLIYLIEQGLVKP